MTGLEADPKVISWQRQRTARQAPVVNVERMEGNYTRGRLIDILDRDWQQDKLPPEHVAVPADQEVSAHNEALRNNFTAIASAVARAQQARLETKWNDLATNILLYPADK